MRDEGLLVAQVETLHCALVAGIAETGDGFAELVIGPLVAYLSQRRPFADIGFVNQAVDDALVAYLERPGRAHAVTGADVMAHLHLASWRNLSNRERGERRRNRRETAYAAEAERERRAAERRVVELCGAAGKVEREESSDSRSTTKDAAHRRELSERDQIIVGLIKAGERKTDVFAQALGLMNLPPDERRRAVKREKDRVKVAIRRHNGGRSSC